MGPRDMYTWVINIKMVLRERGYKPYKRFESECFCKHILIQKVVNELFSVYFELEING